MKYIIFKNKQGLESAIIFPNHVPHIRMASVVPDLNDIWFLRRLLRKRTYKCPVLGTAVSAGFIGFEGTTLICDGTSDSLNLVARPQDSLIVMAELNRREYHNDPLAWSKNDG